MKTIKNIAIIAFENKKTDLIEWSYFNREFLIPHQIFAFGFAGHILEGTLNKKINIIDTVSLTAYKELCNSLNNNQIDAVVIFGDTDQIFESKELNAVLTAATAKNITVAVNRTTADFIIKSPLMQEEYTPHASTQKTLSGKGQATNTGAENYPLAKAS